MYAVYVQGSASPIAFFSDCSGKLKQRACCCKSWNYVKRSLGINMKSSVYVLTSASMPLCKSIDKHENGDLVVKKPQLPTWYSPVMEVVISGIEDFSRLLTSIENDYYKAIVRGALVDGVDLNRPVRRRLSRNNEDDANEAGFIGTKQPWVMLDIDKLPLPDSIDLIQSPREAVDYAASLLPDEFSNVTCHWQISGTAGIENIGTVSAHLFYYLTEPLSDEYLKVWAKRLNANIGFRFIDIALFNPVQLHFTANPMYEEDPLAGRRSGFIEKANDCVLINDIEIPPSIQRPRDSRLPENAKGKGFKTILAEMGDHEGGLGFNEPLTRAIASYVVRAGSDLDEGSLIDYLRSRIDAADTSMHSVQQIDRYKSDDYLMSSINGAVQKFSGTQVRPHFNTEELTLSEGEERLETAISTFKNQVIDYIKADDYFTDAPSLAIKATAGLGKTSRIIKDLISYGVLEHGDVHYYVPTHKLSNELMADLDAELSIETPSFTYIRTQLIAGRGQKGKDGQQLCLKHKLADAIAQRGGRVSQQLCESGSEKCEYFDECAYQKQFEGLDQIIPLSKDDSMYPVMGQVLVFTHAHLFLESSRKITQPKLIVVDEAFYQSGIEMTEVDPFDLKDIGPIPNQLFELIINNEPNLLQTLRDKGIDSFDIREALAKIGADNTVNITPSMTAVQQNSALSQQYTANNASLVLEALAAELEITSRGASNAITWDKSKRKIIVARRKRFQVLDAVPAIFIDANLAANVLNLFRQVDNIINIPVERQAVVHQFIDQTFSKTKLLNDKNSHMLQEQIMSFVQAQTGSTLVVCSKSIKDVLAKDSLDNAAFVHFGSLRGLNQFSDYDNVIIIGREQPSAIGIESQAKALWWDSDEGISSLEMKGEIDSKPLIGEQRGYRVRSENIAKAVVTQVHPDCRVQTILEQVRESESTQAIDRLRLLRANGSSQRQVFILSSVPLDITVDHLWSWSNLQKLLALWDEADGILPLNPKHMIKRCPTLALSERTAKDRAKDLKRTLSLMYTLIREDVLYYCCYSKVGQRKPYTALVSSNMVPDAVFRALMGHDGDVKVTYKPAI